MYGNQYENVVRTPVQTTQQGEIKPLTTGLTDVEGAKAVARRLFDTYDRDRNGQIDNVEVVPMIVDVYKSFNRIFSPSRGDIDSFFKVLDRNNDGRITQQDLEDLCVRYLTNQAPTQMRASEIQQPPTTTQQPQRPAQQAPPQPDVRGSAYGSNRGSGYQANATPSYERPQMP